MFYTLFSGMMRQVCKYTKKRFDSKKPNKNKGMDMPTSTDSNSLVPSFDVAKIDKWLNT